MRAGDADVDGTLDSEVYGIEVFCLQCVYGIASVLRKELRETYDVRALGEAISISSMEGKKFLTEFSRAWSAKLVQHKQSLPQVPEYVSGANLHDSEKEESEK